MNADHRNSDIVETTNGAINKEHEYVHEPNQNRPHGKGTTVNENSEGGVFLNIPKTISQLNRGTPGHQQLPSAKISFTARLSKAFKGLPRTGSDNTFLSSKTEQTQTSGKRRKSLSHILKVKEISRDGQIGKSLSHKELSFLNFLSTADSDMGYCPKPCQVQELQRLDNLAVIQADLQALCADEHSEACYEGSKNRKHKRRTKSVNDIIHKSYFDPTKISHTESDTSSTLKSCNNSLSSNINGEHTAMLKREDLQQRLLSGIGHEHNDHLGLFKSASLISNLTKLNTASETSTLTDGHVVGSPNNKWNKPFCLNNALRGKELLPNLSHPQLHSSSKGLHNGIEITARLRSPIPSGLQMKYKRNRSLSMGDILRLLCIEENELTNQLMDNPQLIFHKFDRNEEHNYLEGNIRATKKSETQENDETVLPQRRYSTSFEHQNIHLTTVGWRSVNESGYFDVPYTQYLPSSSVDMHLNCDVPRSLKGEIAHGFRREHISSTRCRLAKYTKEDLLNESSNIQKRLLLEGPSSKGCSFLDEDHNAETIERKDQQKDRVLSEKMNISEVHQSICGNDSNVKILHTTTSHVEHGNTDSDEIRIESCSFTEKRTSRLHTYSLFLVSLWVMQCKRRKSRRHQRERTKLTQVVASNVNMKWTKTLKSTGVEKETLHENGEIIGENEQLGFEEAESIETFISRSKPPQGVELVTHISTQDVISMEANYVGENTYARNLVDEVSPPLSFRGTYHKAKLETEKAHHNVKGKSGWLDRNPLRVSESKSISHASNTDVYSSDDDVFYSQSPLGPLTPTLSNVFHMAFKLDQQYPLASSATGTLTALLTDPSMASSEADQKALKEEDTQNAIFMTSSEKKCNLFNRDTDPEINPDKALRKDKNSFAHTPMVNHEDMRLTKQAISNEHLQDGESNVDPKVKAERSPRPRMADRCDSFRLDVFEAENPVERARLRSDGSLWGRRVCQLFQDSSLLLDSPDIARKKHFTTPELPRFGLLPSPSARRANEKSNAISRQSTSIQTNQAETGGYIASLDSISCDNSTSQLQIWRTGRVLSPPSPGTKRHPASRRLASLFNCCRFRSCIKSKNSTPIE